MPRVSVMMMTYNRSEMLRGAIEAVLASTFEDFELIILDDASTDDTFEVVKSFADPRIIYLRNNVNRGVISNSDHTWWRARGEFVKPLNDDDEIHPTMLEREVEMMDIYPDVLIVGCNMRVMNEKGRITQRCVDERMKMGSWVYKKGEYIEAYVRDRFIIYWPTYMFRVCNKYWDIVNEPLDVGPLGDILALGRSNLLGSIGYIAEPLIDYRIHSGQETFNVDVLSADIKLHEVLVEKCEAHGLKKLLPHIEASGLRHQIIKEVNNDKVCDKLMDRLYGLETQYPCRYGIPVYPASSINLDKLKKLHGKCVAILGSYLSAFLLNELCYMSGVSVVCYLDDNVARHSQKIIGKPIHPLSWLFTHDHEIDCVLLSNEVRSAVQVKSRVKRYTQAPSIHWRELV